MNTWKRIIALLMAVCLVTGGLAGCGDNGGDSGDAGSGGAGGEALSYFLPETVTPPDGVQSVSRIEYLDDTLYLTGDDAQGNLVICTMDGSGEWTRLDTDLESWSVSGFYPDGESGFWLLLTDYGDMDELEMFEEDQEEDPEEDVTFYDEDYDVEVDYFLRHIDENGDILLDQSVYDQLDTYFPTAVVADGEGNIYVSSYLQTLILDSQGTLKATADVGADSGGLAHTGEGRIVACEAFTGELYEIDPATGELSDPFALEDTDAVTLAPGGDSGVHYYTTGGLYHLDLDTGASTEVMRWLDSDIYAEEITQCRAVGDGTYYVIRQENMLASGGIIFEDSGTGTVVRLSEGEDPNLNKTTLRFATLNPDSSLRSAVVSFNQSSTDYRVELEDYSLYNTADDETAGLTRLNTEIISGDVPDLMDLTGLAAEKYMGMGLLADLYPYLDGDDTVGREDLMDNVLEALDQDGALYQLVTNFSVSTAVGRASAVGEDSGWTFDEFKALTDTLVDGEESFAGLSNQQFLRLMAQANMDQFIDWDTGTSQFDGQAFRDLLDMASAFDDEADEDASPELSLARDRALLNHLDIADETTYQIYEALLENDIVFKGLPTADGTGGNAIVPISSLAIAESGEHKDGAWSFISYLLTEDQQDKVVSGYPLRDSSLTKKLESYMQQDEEDGMVYGVVVMLGDDEGDSAPIELMPLSEEAIDRISTMVRSADGLLTTDETLLEIIQEEAEAYFSGAKGAEEVTEVIQNRVSTYISEQG